MRVQSIIEDKLAEALQPDYLEVVNESSGHNVPAGSESHFKVVLVSDRFVGERLLGRHRAVNRVLADELAGPVHALAIHTYSRAEWEQRFGAVPESPHCRGGDGAARVAEDG
ncbi:MAG TPA: transcriptional regulator BolA [Pseudomonadales bacterium]|nr:transcriptional regulator BolA [Pseudomonadales bacterium]